jgi:hypothetical protein
VRFIVTGNTYPQRRGPGEWWLPGLLVLSDEDIAELSANGGLQYGDIQVNLQPSGEADGSSQQVRPDSG